MNEQPPREHIPTPEETIAELKSALEDRDRKIEELTKMAYTDELTGLDNRRKFNEEFARRKSDREERGPAPEDKPDVLLILDLDNFKIVNDAFKEGHTGGDRALKAAAEHLMSLVREQFRADDVVARYGGEEFAVLLKEVDVAGLMERLKLGIMVELDGEPTPITFSGGYTVVNHGEDIETAFSRADEALFVAKEDIERPDGTIARGRNRILPYSENIKEEMEEKARLLHA